MRPSTIPFAIRALMSAIGLMICSVAWPGVAVHESPSTQGPTNTISEDNSATPGDSVSPEKTPQPTNTISEGNFGSGKIGGLPPKPWLCSKNTETVHVTVETPAGRPEAERWVRVVDNSDKENANLRQNVRPVANGRFQARLISNKDGGRLYFNLGTGAASKPEERAMQLSIDADGSLVVRGDQKAKATMRIKAGEVYLVRCDFEPIRDGSALRVLVELIEEKTQRQGRLETEVMTQIVITAVRVTSTKTETGVDFFVTDLGLTGR